MDSQSILTQLPSWLPAYWVAVTVGRVALAIVVILAVRKAVLVRRERHHWSGFFTMSALVVLWAVAAIVAGYGGFFELSPDVLFPPNIMGSVLVPVIFGYLLFRHWGLLRAVILSIPSHWIIALQVLRVSGGIFLYVFALGLVPGIFALSAGIGDFVTGFLAIPVAYYLYKKKPWARKLAIGWNWLGLAELIMLMPLGLISSPSPVQMVSFDAPNFVTSFWPSVLAPSFHVPLGILLHIFSLVQLSRQRDEEKVKTRPWNLAWQAMALGAAIYFLYPILFYIISPLKTGRQISFQIHPVIRESFTDRYLALYIHIIPSMFALIIGPLQFVSSFRKKFPHIHRAMGRFYLVGGILVGGLAAFYLAMHSFAGIAAQLGFGVQAIVLLFTGYMAYIAIRERKINIHREWMMRNYALIFAAVTLRINIRLFILLGYELPDFHFVNAWLCWVPNLLVAEWLIRRKRARAAAVGSLGEITTSTR